ncbi:MAG: hypothetical protein ACPLW8_00095 [Candidatus Bathyarchaeales archaeon]
MILFTEHAKTKLQILKNPDELLYDVLTGRYVALNWTHNTAIIYEKTKKNITVVTIIYSSELMDIMNKRKRIGRWI